ncbi:pyrroline-5-carboxylate reductase [Clostridium fallax]|uniref:Pyrroline-5-carboxylate reductase n=1 Tax=Clostridium fallax TaxID=1533 RepID=A0A1M4ZHA1_9CLOT|nr:pyrroline-5-carboxylate reductase [Clostridium fallax]SHF16966.1 pyrroline-5-carboxylate reductase [Clostridium fallax]SQB06385.1 pyrroline-5-carboxylate reductase [Clostridium fallax]
MNKVIGFIGSGNMGQAIVGGIVGSKLVSKDNIILSDLNESNLLKAKKNFGVKITEDNKEVAKVADILILSVKPNLYPIVIEEIKDFVKDNVIIVTIAAGKSLESTKEAFGKDIKVVRVMPNTPSLVREGMAAICYNNAVDKEELKEVINIFESFGKAEIIQENLMDVVTSVSGSSPAYVFLFIEAMADAAVLDGMPRDKAYRFAAQAVLGSAKMVLETGIHPGALKDMVCSPGGTTIEAVATLEEEGFRNAVIKAMRSCTKKSQEMSK